MEKISVIVPVYNVEPYIKKCLDSIINQTYTNLEILLIDDGSTDCSGKICDEYAKKDSRIRVFHKVNGGVSSARNIGLKNLMGNYIGFVDPDDWIEPDMYEVLYKALSDNQVHLSAVNSLKDAGNASIVETGSEEIPKRILTQKEMLLYVFRTIRYAGFGCEVWNKLFRTDIIREHNFLFDEGLKNWEDLKFISCLIASCNITGVFINEPLYHHVQRPDSLSRPDLAIHPSLYFIKSHKGIIEMADKYGFYDITVWKKRDYCYSASLLAEAALANNDKKNFKQMQDEINLYLKEYIETNAEHPERIERINRLVKMRFDH